jgi:hypothetical protein
MCPTAKEACADLAGRRATKPNDTDPTLAGRGCDRCDRVLIHRRLLLDPDVQPRRSGTDPTNAAPVAQPT